MIAMLFIKKVILLMFLSHHSSYVGADENSSDITSQLELSKDAKRRKQLNQVMCKLKRALVERLTQDREGAGCGGASSVPNWVEIEKQLKNKDVVQVMCKFGDGKVLQKATLINDTTEWKEEDLHTFASEDDCKKALQKAMQFIFDNRDDCLPGGTHTKDMIKQIHNKDVNKPERFPLFCNEHCDNLLTKALGPGPLDFSPSEVGAIFWGSTFQRSKEGSHYNMHVGHKFLGPKTKQIEGKKPSTVEQTPSGTILDDEKVNPALVDLGKSVTFKNGFTQTIYTKGHAFYYWNCASERFARAAAEKQKKDEKYPIYVFGQDSQAKNPVGLIPTWWNLELPNIVSVFSKAKLEYRMFTDDDINSSKEENQVKAVQTEDKKVQYLQDEMKEALKDVYAKNVMQKSYEQYMNLWDKKEGFPRYAISYQKHPVTPREMLQMTKDIKEAHLKNEPA